MGKNVRYLVTLVEVFAEHSRLDGACLLVLRMGSVDLRAAHGAVELGFT